MNDLFLSEYKGQSHFPPLVNIACNFYRVFYEQLPEADPGFQVRGGALKKIAPSRGRREIFGGISCEKSRFYAKKSYFFRF
jgi:hypothetical protein